VHEFALVVLETLDIWHFPFIQNPASVDEELCFIVDDSVCSDVSNLEFPDTFRCVPLGVLNLMLELDVFVDEIVLFVYCLQVFEDLW